MRGFNYFGTYKDLISSVSLPLLCRLHELEGTLRALVRYQPSLLGGFEESARRFNTVTFSRRSGLRVSETKVSAIVLKKAKPENGDELLAFAYCDIIKDIAVLGEARNPACGKETGKGMKMITQGDLNSIDVPTVAVMGGVGCKADARKTPYSASVLMNLVRDSADFNERDNQSMVNEMIADFNHVMSEKTVEPVLLALCFEMDYSFIQYKRRGFKKNDHILLLLLLSRVGFNIGKYASLEQFLDERRDQAETAFSKSTKDWMKGIPDYTHYITFLLKTLIDAYQRLFDSLPFSDGKRHSRSDIVLNFIIESRTDVSKKAIMSALPWISQKSVERALQDLQKQNSIVMKGNGRASTYKVSDELMRRLSNLENSQKNSNKPGNACNKIVPLPDPDQEEK